MAAVLLVQGADLKTSQKKIGRNCPHFSKTISIMLFQVLITFWCLNWLVFAVDVPSLFEGTWIIHECTAEPENAQGPFSNLCDKLIVQQWTLQKDADTASTTNKKASLFGKWLVNETVTNTTTEEKYLRIDFNDNLRGQMSVGPSPYDLTTVTSFEFIEMSNGQLLTHGFWFDGKLGNEDDAKNQNEQTPRKYQLTLSELPGGTGAVFSLTLVGNEKNMFTVWSGKNNKIIEKSFLTKYGPIVMTVDKTFLVDWFILFSPLEDKKNIPQGIVYPLFVGMIFHFLIRETSIENVIWI
ncbi:hypothetical protein RFI_31843 [Reticulomyxa filosa]|uniref:Uncharacterized protein n=1 Tax=Reticulomyxa filosa TaxID=46433 RepID=X6LUF2_RETFI|nr:hypothetical protein RFI_31843 [Reticulomyxa filosa]|eukprot:ETO05553.1 hypothetical protein RFI_31843 [Reticulomyxa filosa]